MKAEFSILSSLPDKGAITEDAFNQIELKKKLANFQALQATLNAGNGSRRR